MTTINDLHQWLQSPAGHVLQAQRGGYQQALAALVDEDRQMRAAAYDLNNRRERDGLRALTADEAANAVRPVGGPQVAGDVTRKFRDPSWRLRAGSDDTADTPVHWERGSLAMINGVRAHAGQEPLQP